MELIQIDGHGQLFISPAIDDWKPLYEQGITAIIDLDAGVDEDIPTVPNHVLYVYFPFSDADLPNLHKLHAIGQMGARLIESGHKVLSHCGMGYNRSALIAGLILINRGLSGEQACDLLREKRPGALFNETFAAYLKTLSKMHAHPFDAATA